MADETIVMKSDPEAWLEQLTPRGAFPDVRARVLAMVNEELRASARVPWGRWCGSAIAAGLVIGIALNGWVSWRQEERLTRLYGPPVIPASVAEIAQVVESVTDKPTARWFEQCFRSARRRPYSLAQHAQDFERFIREWEDWKDNRREKIQKGSQDRSDRARGTPGALAHRQRNPHLDYRIPT
jgi:hypothetical protein